MRYTPRNEHPILGTFLAALMVVQLASPGLTMAQADSRPQTPIKHLIVIIGENRTFDHVFATYQPKVGESISNLLSKGIVKEDGTPGPNFSLAA